MKTSFLTIPKIIKNFVQSRIFTGVIAKWVAANTIERLVKK